MNIRSYLINHPETISFLYGILIGIGLVAVIILLSYMHQIDLLNARLELLNRSQHTTYNWLINLSHS